MKILILGLKVKKLIEVKFLWNLRSIFDFARPSATFHAGAGETQGFWARGLSNGVSLICDHGIRSRETEFPVFQKWVGEAPKTPKPQNPLMMKRMIRIQYVLDIS